MTEKTFELRQEHRDLLFVLAKTGGRLPDQQIGDVYVRATFQLICQGFIDCGQLTPEGWAAARAEVQRRENPGVACD